MALGGTVAGGELAEPRASAPGRWWWWPWAHLRVWWLAASTRRRLRALPPRLLRDVGVEREAIDRIARDAAYRAVFGEDAGAGGRSRRRMR